MGWSWMHGEAPPPFDGEEAGLVTKTIWKMIYTWGVEGGMYRLQWSLNLKMCPYYPHLEFQHMPLPPLINTSSTPKYSPYLHIAEKIRNLNLVIAMTPDKIHWWYVHPTRIEFSLALKIEYSLWRNTCTIQILYACIRWNPSNPYTLGTKEIVPICEVS